VRFRFWSVSFAMLGVLLILGTGNVVCAALALSQPVVLEAAVENVMRVSSLSLKARQLVKVARSGSFRTTQERQRVCRVEGESA